ncbi:MAG: PIG-L deacetylase family protein [Pleomorphochaeta sp.]|jgi:LmbE family N-acetylglucosaminyl deacetylase
MLDILFIGAHPDDEQAIAGTLLLAKKEGLKTGAIILTKGESGGFASKETRVKELNQAAIVMDLDYLKNLDFEDSNVEFSREAVDKIIPYLVETKPKIIITIHPDDYHPDHLAVSKIVDRTVFVAGLKKYMGDETWHPCQLLYVSLDSRTNEKRPDILINIDEVISEKIKSMKCYRSQQIDEHLLIGCKNLGTLAGCEYAEGLYNRQPIVLDKINSLITKKQYGR